MVSYLRVLVTAQNNLCGSVTTQNIKTEIVRKEYVNETLCYTDKRKSKIVNEVDTIIIDVD